MTIDLAPEDPLPDADPVEPIGAGPDDVAAIFYTSGTTGWPKGVNDSIMPSCLMQVKL